MRQQFEKERKRHRQEREREAATIEKLKRELDEENGRGCRCWATNTSATKESGSTGGTPAATTESKKSSESVGVHESTSGSSSEGKQL